MKKTLSSLLIIVIICNFIVLGIMSYSPVQAGFWDDNKDGIMTVVKGFIMLWIMNLIRENVVNNDDDIITSTIKKGLNIDGEKAQEKEEETIIIEEVTTRVTEQERIMIELVNDVRIANGLSSLKIDDQLTDIARMKARDMISNNYFDHYSPTYGSPFTMMKDQGVKYLLAGENLASSRTVQKGFEGLMNSPEHKENIMDNRYDSIGVGIIKGNTGKLMIVQLFTDSPDILK